MRHCSATQLIQRCSRTPARCITSYDRGREDTPAERGELSGRERIRALATCGDFVVWHSDPLCSICILYERTVLVTVQVHAGRSHLHRKTVPGRRRRRPEIPIDQDQAPNLAPQPSHQTSTSGVEFFLLANLR